MKTISVKLAVSQLALAMTLFAGAASADTLTLYTSQPEADAATTVEAFKKAHPGTDVQIYRSGTSDILGKPFTESELLMAVRRSLARSAPQSA